MGLLRTHFRIRDSCSSCLGLNQDAFIAEFNNTNTQVWTTLFGGNGAENGTDMKIDPSNNIYIAGITNTATLASVNNGINSSACNVPNNQTDFPDFDPGSGAYHQTAYGGGQSDAFIAEFSSAGCLLWSTMYGGTADEGVVLSNFLDRDLIYRNEESQVSVAINPMNASQVTLSGTVGFTATGAAGVTNYSGSQYGQSSTSGIRSFIAQFSGRAQGWTSMMGTNLMTGVGATYDNSNNIITMGTQDDGSGTYATNTCAVPASVNTQMPFCAPSNTFSQTNYGGTGQTLNGGDGYMTGFNGADELVWGTFYGGEDQDVINATAYDATNNYMYITGGTRSNCYFPLYRPNANYFYQTTNATTNSLGNNAFIGRFKLGLGMSTGIANKAANGQDMLSIYPNPANDKLNIVLPVNIVGNITIQIVDITGQVAQDNIFPNAYGTIQLDTKGLSSGIYVIKVLGASFSGVSKFVKSE